MKEKIENDCPMLVGFIVAMCIIDLFSNDSFNLLNMLLRIIVIVVVYVLFRFIELKRKEISYYSGILETRKTKKNRE